MIYTYKNHDSGKLIISDYPIDYADPIHHTDAIRFLKELRDESCYDHEKAALNELIDTIQKIDR